LIGRVDFGLELNGFHGRPFEAKGLDVIATFAAHAFDLQTARERVGVVLESDDTLDTAGLVIDQNDATAKQARGAGK
jgi:hypothetical protein